MDKAQMEDALKRVVVPVLRDRAFKGSWPHFRRHSGSRLHLLSFQFDKYGGGFIVEISHCAGEGITTSWGQKIPPNKLDVSYRPPKERLRLGTGPMVHDYWFRYDEASTASTGEDLCKQVLELLDAQAEPWWQSAEIQ